jgi:hypothetical protein
LNFYFSGLRKFLKNYFFNKKILLGCRKKKKILLGYRKYLLKKIKIDKFPLKIIMVEF